MKGSSQTDEKSAVGRCALSLSVLSEWSLTASVPLPLSLVSILVILVSIPVILVSILVILISIWMILVTIRVILL